MKKCEHRRYGTRKDILREEKQRMGKNIITDFLSNLEAPFQRLLMNKGPCEKRKMKQEKNGRSKEKGEKG